jgi:hypothetical protein
MPAKTQKDINCGTNSDQQTTPAPPKLPESDTNKDPGKAVDVVYQKLKTAAKREQLAFKTLHCPPDDANDKRICTKKENEKGDEKDITYDIKLAYDQAKQEFTATGTATWTASFDCIEPGK